MGTAAFDTLWGDGSPPKTAAFDAAWDGTSHPSIHDEYKSGRLGKRMARENANDQELAAADDQGYGTRLATHVLNAAQGIPGVAAVEAGAGALSSRLTNHPMTYDQSLATLQGQTGQIGGKTSMAEKAMGGLAAVPFLPANPVTGGAMLGAADQALDAEPNSLPARVARTATGALGGAAAGKAAELIPTIARTLMSKGAASNVFAREAARAESAGPLFKQALTDGVGKTNTPAIQHAISQPDIAEIISGLRETRQFAGMAPEDPRVLDAAYKVLSDQSGQIKRGLDAVTPTRPNIGRFREQDIRAAKNDLLDGMSGGTTMPGPMAAYRPAVQSWADQSAGIQGVQRGNDALLDAVNNRLVRGKQLTRTTPEAAADWGENASAPMQQAAGEGVLGAVRDAFSGFSPKRGLRAAMKGPSVLRELGAPQQAQHDLISQLALALANGWTR